MFSEAGKHPRGIDDILIEKSPVIIEFDNYLHVSFPTAEETPLSNLAETIVLDDSIPWRGNVKKEFGLRPDEYPVYIQAKVAQILKRNFASRIEIPIRRNIITLTNDTIPDMSLLLLEYISGILAQRLEYPYTIDVVRPSPVTMSLDLQRELGGAEYHAALYNSPHARIQFADYLVLLPGETDEEIRTLAEAVALDDTVPWDNTASKDAVHVEMSIELRTKMRKKEIARLMHEFRPVHAIRIRLIDQVCLIMNNSEWYVVYYDNYIRRHVSERLLQYAFEILRTTRDYTLRVIQQVSYFMPIQAVDTLPFPDEAELVANKEALERTRTYTDRNGAIEHDARQFFECAREADHVTVTYPTATTQMWYENHMRLVRATTPD